MAEHTPGPWSYSYDEERGEHAIYMDPALEGKAVKQVSRFIEWEHMIYPDDGDGSDFREADANVRLIAVAPKLLEAAMTGEGLAESLFEPFEERVDYAPDSQLAQELAELRKELPDISKAIAEARGEES